MGFRIRFARSGGRPDRRAARSGYDTGMSDADALLAAIIADPDDDTPRLVYADWPDENGDPDRAAFIRVGVRRANAGRLTSEYHELLGRELELFMPNRAKWSAPFAPWAGLSEMVFGRGFVEELNLRADTYATRPASLFRLSPLLEDRIGAEPPAEWQQDLWNRD